MVKHYAVVKGHKTGIFTSWSEVKPLVIGYPGAKHKSFATYDLAKAYLNGEDNISKLNEIKISDNNDNEIPLTMESQYDVVIYTDGSSQSEKAGYGVVITINDKVIDTFNGPLSSVKYPNGTNNQAELYAIKIAIQQSKKYQKILIMTDSQLCINILTKWYHSWIRNGWKTAQGTDVKNKELIQEIIKDINADQRIFSFQHVKAHSGIKYNEMADQLADVGREQA